MAEQQGKLFNDGIDATLWMCPECEVLDDSDGFEVLESWTETDVEDDAVIYIRIDWTVAPTENTGVVGDLTLQPGAIKNGNDGTGVPSETRYRHRCRDR